MKRIIFLLFCLGFSPLMPAQNSKHPQPWNTQTLLKSYRILQPQSVMKPEFTDPDNDGDHDLIK